VTEAIRLDPTQVEAHTQLAFTLRRMGRTDEAIAHLAQAIKTLPGEALLHHALAECYTDTGQKEQAEKSYSRVAELLPDSAAARKNFGVSLLFNGKPEEAISHLRKALELKSDFRVARHYLADALEKAGNVDEASRIRDQLLEEEPGLGPALEPMESAAYTLAANLMDQRGQRARAIEVLRRGSASLPNDPDIANDLAWRLATSPDVRLRNGDEAVALAERAVAVGRREDPHVLDTLAAAYAEAGRFGEAVATATRALEAAEGKDAQFVASVTARRSLYEQRVAYHAQ
jgi:spermidine synthase